MLWMFSLFHNILLLIESLFINITICYISPIVKEYYVIELGDNPTMINIYWLSDVKS